MFKLFSLLGALALLLVAALDLPSAAAQNDEQTGRIVARLLDDGRVEFGWQPSSGARVLPRARYFPTDATVDRWLNSSPVEVNGRAIGRINARLLENGRIEFAFTPTDGERITPRARYFPANARVDRWLRSTEITIGPPVDAATGFTAISAGQDHACAIRTSGEIACWGANGVLILNPFTGESHTETTGESDAPEGSFTAVAAGNTHTCAIRGHDGAIQCWGSNTNGSTSPPATAANYTAIGVGWGHGCAIRDTGEIDCWGNDHNGQTDAPEGRFTAISVGWGHTCAIRAGSGAIDCWGDNGYRTWDPETEEEAYVETGQSDAPEGSFIAVSGGRTSTCAIRAGSGAIDCWGNDHNGQTDAPEGRFTAISVGWGHTCAIRAGSGAIDCWGDNGYRTWDPETEEEAYVETGQSDAPEGSFIAVSGGRTSTCAIRAGSGAIDCWGDFAEADVPDGRYVAISHVNNHTCAIRDTGEVKCWGFDIYGEADAPEGRFTAVGVGYGYSCAIRESGEIVCWGMSEEKDPDRYHGQTEPPPD